MEQMRMVRVLGVILVLLAGSSWLRARPDEPPSEELVTRLIAEEAEVLSSTISIAVIVDGEARLGKNFLTREAVHVSFIWNVTEAGRRVRRAEERTFFWNEKYGWFIYRVVNPRGGQAIDICSERLGLLRIR